MTIYLLDQLNDNNKGNKRAESKTVLCKWSRTEAIKDWNVKADKQSNMEIYVPKYNTVVLRIEHLVEDHHPRAVLLGHSVSGAASWTQLLFLLPLITGNCWCRLTSSDLTHQMVCSLSSRDSARCFRKYANKLATA